jgi:hypothetical protein
MKGNTLKTPLVVHLLKENGAAQAPFADQTLCGLPAEGASAMWPGEPLSGTHWGKRYRVNGKWCQACKERE